MTVELNDEAEAIAAYLAKFVGPNGYINRTKDPQLADFMAYHYEEGVKMAAIRLAGPESSPDQRLEAAEAIKSNIGEILGRA